MIGWLYTDIYGWQAELEKMNWVSASIYQLKVNNRNTSTRCETFSKLIIKTPERRHWRRSGVFIVNLEYISHLVLVFLLLTLNMQFPAGVFVNLAQFEKRRFDKILLISLTQNKYPAGIYLLKVNNRKTRARFETCSKLTIKTPERRHWCHFGVFTVNFEHIWHLVLVLLLLTLN